MTKRNKTFAELAKIALTKEYCKFAIYLNEEQTDFLKKNIQPNPMTAVMYGHFFGNWLCEAKVPKRKNKEFHCLLLLFTNELFNDIN